MQQQKFSAISFYIIAHADDWQLFMQPVVLKELLNTRTKVVFIITTAGDAGFPENFWRAREEGMKSSLRFCLAPLGSINERIGINTVCGHNINYCSVNETLCFFLRLPDGNLDSKGFDRYSREGLFKLQKDEAISTVDNSSVYSSWKDLCNTLQSIILIESDQVVTKSLHYLNPDTSLNPNDHPDHILTGQAIQSMNIINNTWQYLYTGYSVINAEKYLSSEDSFWKAGMFAAYEKAVFDKSGYSTLKEGIRIYLNWLKCAAIFEVKNPSLSSQ